MGYLISQKLATGLVLARDHALRNEADIVEVVHEIITVPEAVHENALRRIGAAHGVVAEVDPDIIDRDHAPPQGK